jgi:hypothetical protein
MRPAPAAPCVPRMFVIACLPAGALPATGRTR